MTLKEATEENPAAGLAYALFTLFAIFPSVCFSGFVLLKLYEWFLAGVPGLPPLTLVNMVGVELIVAVLLIGVQSQLVHQDTKYKSVKDAFNRSMTSMFYTPALVLLLGWLFHMWLT